MSDSITSDHILNVADIKDAVSKLKSHKGDGSSYLISDHIVNAGDEFLCHNALLFTAIVVHGSVSESFLSSTIMHILQCHNANTSDTANFRGIALSSLYGKIFDNNILVRCCNKLIAREL
jgi:hypothetical protein